MHHRRALVVSALAASLCLPSTAFAARRGQHEEAARGRDGQRDPAARAGVPGDRQRQRRHACVGHAGLRGVAAVRQGPPAAAGYRVKRAGVHVPVLPRARARPCSSRRRRRRRTYETGTFDYSGSGDVTAPVQAVDVEFPPAGAAGTTDSGCEASDFAGFTRRQHRADPARLLQLRGQGRQRQGRRRLGRDHLQRGPGGPARSCSSARSATRRTSRSSGSATPTPRRSTQQITAGPVTLHVTTSTEADLEAKTKNLIADTKQGNADETVVVGAHLDSVVAGPGINDNGSGSATILEIAEAMAEQKIKPRRALRFTFWGAEESGLLGSEHYVEHAARGPAGPDLREPQLRHGRLAQLRPLRLRRRRLRHARRRARPARRRSRPCSTNYFAGAGPRERPDGLRRPLGLRPVHRGRHPGRRPLHRRRGRQDRRAGGDLRRHRRRRLRPLLPPGLRHDEQPVDEGAERDVRRRRARDADARAAPRAASSRTARARPQRNKAKAKKFNSRDGA